MSIKPSVRPVDPVGQLLFVGISGTVLTPETRSLLERVRPGGVILFKRNVDTLPGLKALAAEIQGAVFPPPLLAIDEEGGRVTRLTPHISGLPAAWTTASFGAARLTEYWKRYGELLAALGMDIDFAPVVDLCPNDAPNGIADRSYGTDPEKVIECASAAIAGLRAAGMTPTIKHFPGLGDTLLDSHHHLPSVQKKREAFEREDLVPFTRLGATSPAVMVGHGHYPWYAGPDPIAATLTKEISTALLRNRCGYRGCAISDDLEMKAVAVRVAWDELAPRAIESGNDMVLICHTAERILASHEALRRRAEREPAFAARAHEAAGRVAALRAEAAAIRAAAHPAGAIEGARIALLEAAGAGAARA